MKVRLWVVGWVVVDVEGMASRGIKRWFRDRLTLTLL